MAALEQVFELDAAFNDGQLSVYRSGRPVDELMDGMRQAVRDIETGRTVPVEEVREQTLDATDSEDDPGDAATEDIPSDREKSETGTADSSEENDSTHDSDGEESGSGPKCQHCGKSCKNNAGRASHERYCNENPASDDGGDDAGDDESASEVTCEHCGDSFPQRGLGPHQRFCEDNPANTDDESEDDDTQENTSDGDTSADENENSVESDDTNDGGLAAKKPAAIRKAMENPDDLPEDPVPVGVAIQYNAGSYTCKSCDTCLRTDKELTEHVNEEGHRGAFQVNRRRYQ